MERGDSMHLTETPQCLLIMSLGADSMHLIKTPQCLLIMSLGALAATLLRVLLNTSQREP